MGQHQTSRLFVDPAKIGTAWCPTIRAVFTRSCTVALPSKVLCMTTSFLSLEACKTHLNQFSIQWGAKLWKDVIMNLTQSRGKISLIGQNGAYMLDLIYLQISKYCRWDSLKNTTNFCSGLQFKNLKQRREFSWNELDTNLTKNWKRALRVIVKRIKSISKLILWETYAINAKSLFCSNQE